MIIFRLTCLVGYPRTSAPEPDNVPEELKSLKHIKDLWLEFTGKIIIPDWMDNIEIDEFFVEGTISSEEEAKLVRRFPNISISSR